jgi:hypothetical protein
MTSRILAGGIIAVGIGAITLPLETSAGSGGLSAAAPLAASAFVRPSFSPSQLLHMSGRSAGQMRGFRRSEPVERQVSGFPSWWGDVSAWPNDYPYPYGYAAPYAEPAQIHPTIEDWSERSRPVVTRAPECRTDTQEVPSETGGRRTINITRCY